MFILSLDKLIWTRINLYGENELQRAAHVMEQISENWLIIFGGTGSPDMKEN